MRGESESGREGENVRHFSSTFGSQSDQLNHLPPADLKKTFINGFVRVLSALHQKNQSHISYRFLDLTIRKLQTDTRTRIFFEIISTSTD